MTMTCSEHLTFDLEFWGSLLMGLDYLFNVRQIGLLESHAKAIAEKLASDFTNDINERIALLRKRAHLLLAGGLMFSAGAAIWGLLSFIQPSNPLVVVGLILLVLFLVMGPMVEFGTHLLAVVFPTAVNLVPLLLIKLVSASPRGIIAGTGFLLFLASFACKYSRLGLAAGA